MQESGAPLQDGGWGTGAAEWGWSERLGHIPRAMLGLLRRVQEDGAVPWVQCRQQGQGMLGGLGGCGDAILVGDRGRSRAL